ncbi:MAG: hypothetical protein IT306_25595 [Chloroflexi bacterium]|nr:hypothetical protein [Chloroflexota bacterium]
MKVQDRSASIALSQQYRITEQNLALRKQLLGITERDVKTLRSLGPWARRVAPSLLRDFYEHQFSHPGTRAFFEAQAVRMGLPLPQLRAHLEKAQVAFFIRIFAEAEQGGQYGVPFFEERLKIGKLHNVINLPLKWYVASYGVYTALVRKYLYRSFMLRPDVIVRGERAIQLIFNYDMQAVCDAFFYDYLQSVGLDLTSVRVDSAEEDLSEHYDALKTTVREAISGATQASGTIVSVSGELFQATAGTAGAVQHVTDAMQALAAGANDNARNAQESSESMRQLAAVIESIAQSANHQADQVRTVTDIAERMASSVEQVARDGAELERVGETTRELAERGAGAVRETVAGIAQLKSVVGAAAQRVEQLGKLGERIGAVVETIDDIAEQTNLLALNAAIEAARAGEHGRGFAVVADEVRKLAERSQRETRAIADLIREVQTGTREAVAAMEAGSDQVENGAVQADQAGEALSQILSSVQMTVARVAGIANVTQEMTAGARGVVEAMNEMRAIVQDNGAATEEMAAQAEHVMHVIESFAAVTEESSAMTEQISASAEAVMAQVEETNAQASVLSSTAEQLQDRVAVFRLEEGAVTPPAHRGAAQRPAAAPAAVPAARKAS